MARDGSAQRLAQGTSLARPYFLARVLLLLLHWVSISGSVEISTVHTQLAVDTRSVLEERVSKASNSLYSTRFANVSWDNSKWQLRNTNLDQGHYQARMSVANGYIGINVAALGPFFEVDESVNGDNVNGWPLFDRRQTFATIGGFWASEPKLNGTNFPWLSQYGWDTAISGIPHWSGIILDLGDGVFLNASTDNKTISNFSSMLDLKQGVMNWAYTWTPTNDQSFDITYQIFTHKLHVNRAFVKMTICSRTATNATVVNVLNGDCALRTDFKAKAITSGYIYSAVSPNAIPSITGFVYASMNTSGAELTASPKLMSGEEYLGNNISSIAQGYPLSLEAGEIATIIKYVGIASSDAFSDANSTAQNAMFAAQNTGYMASMGGHAAEWEAVFPKTSVDDYSFPENGSLPDDPYIIESAITAVTNPYYLLQQTISANASAALESQTANSYSIAVSGLGSESYAGQIFWDAEVWMQPGLVAAHPAAAEGIANYRVARYGQALANAQTAYQSSKNNTQFSKDAAVFSWTSGRFGNCTATGPCFDYEYHINGDIAQEFVNYWVASGDTNFFQDKLFPIYNSIATFFSEVLTKKGSQYSLSNMTDPDEFANMVDNGGFTMPLIADTLTNANTFRAMFNMSSNSTWATQAQNVLISRNADAGIILEYTGMNGSIDVKQADVVLDTFPLSYTNNYTTQDSLNDLDYYASKQSLDGPGMTYAIFSIVANEVSPSGCSAYTYQQYSEQPYARAPWFQFSEQLIDDYQANGGTHPAFPFLTGHGGANQVVLFGYLGLRLLPDWSLHIDPALPPQIPQIRYRTFYWHGWPISTFSNATHTTLTRLPNPYTTYNSTFATAPIPVFISSSQTSSSIGPNSTLTVPNRIPGLLTTIQGNLLQCHPATSPDPFVQGQFPISAIDGAASTKWQPSFANISSSITVTLTPGVRVKEFYFDWAQAPPANFSVSFSNLSAAAAGPDAVTVANQSQVQISNPYNASAAVKIVPYSSNTTTYSFTVAQEAAGVYTGMYATLTIWGSQLNGPSQVNNGTGGMVAEWAIIEDGGASVSMKELGAPVFAKRETAWQDRTRDVGTERWRRYMAQPDRRTERVAREWVG